MHYRILITALAFFFSLHGLMAQVIVDGKVVDTNGEPLPFVSIGIDSTYVGTISEFDGTFRMEIPQAFTSRQIIFSSVGYLRQQLHISQVLNQPTIALHESITRLLPVEVTDGKLKSRKIRLGTRENTGRRFMTDRLYTGSAIAQLFNNPKDTLYLQQISLGLENFIPDLQGRITLRKVTADGKPGVLLYDWEFIMVIPKTMDFLTIDIREERILVTEEQFYVIVEPLIIHDIRERFQKRVEEILVEQPDAIEILDNGELYIPNYYRLGLQFIMFKIYEEGEGTAYYRTSSFGIWRPSEQVAMRLVGSGFD